MHGKIASVDRIAVKIGGRWEEEGSNNYIEYQPLRLKTGYQPLELKRGYQPLRLGRGYQPPRLARGYQPPRLGGGKGGGTWHLVELDGSELRVVTR